MVFASAGDAMVSRGLVTVRDRVCQKLMRAMSFSSGHVVTRKKGGRRGRWGSDGRQDELRACCGDGTPPPRSGPVSQTLEDQRMDGWACMIL